MPAYSGKAQPYLDAIAASIFTSQAARDWLIVGTPIEPQYLGADVLIDEQQTVRWRKGRTTQPFWANYWCGRDSRCTCRIEGSKGLESDAIFFLRNRANRILAVHVEFKHPNEPFGYGQLEAYPLRATCFAKTHGGRPTLNPHDDWATVLFCGTGSLSDERVRYFDRIITHDEATRIIPAYPRAVHPNRRSGPQTAAAGTNADRCRPVGRPAATTRVCYAATISGGRNGMQKPRKVILVFALITGIGGGAYGADPKNWEACDSACRTSTSYCESVVYPDHLSRPPAELNACTMGGGSAGEGPMLRASKCLLACARRFPKKPWWQFW